jgi:hypothetical protein
MKRKAGKKERRRKGGDKEETGRSEGEGREDILKKSQ